MILIGEWMADLTAKLKDIFGARLLFVGLQGSYRRGEEAEGSDKACGFISGKQELINWPKHELFQFKNDTLALYRSLDELLPEISREDIIEGVRIAASDIYHLCCHTYIHAERASFCDALRGFYKGAFFVLQGLHYLHSGEYIGSKKELILRLEGTGQQILKVSMDWTAYADVIAVNPDTYFEKLIVWYSEILSNIFYNKDR